MKLAAPICFAVSHGCALGLKFLCKHGIMYLKQIKGNRCELMVPVNPHVPHSQQG